MNEDSAITLQRDIGKLWGSVKESRAVIAGHSEKISSLEDFKEQHEKQHDDLMDRLRRYEYSERRDTCFGLKELARREEFAEVESEKEAEEEAEVTAASIQAEVQRSVARSQNVGIIINAIISACAIIAVAIISRGGL